jgi:hypothetical protein
MLHPVKSFDELSLKVVAVRAADNSDFEFEFPPSGPQSTPSVLVAALQGSAQRHRTPFARIGGWHHGGINE